MSQDDPQTNDPDDELRTADELLGKADALLQRRRGRADESDADRFIALDEEDLPLLTDIVDPSELPQAQPTPPLPAPPAPAVGANTATAAETADSMNDRRIAGAIGKPLAETAPPARSADRFADVDAALQQAVEAWFATEFPQLLSRELDAFAARLQQETLAQLRTALLRRLGTGDAAGAPR